MALREAENRRRRIATNDRNRRLRYLSLHARENRLGEICDCVFVRHPVHGAGEEDGVRVAPGAARRPEILSVDSSRYVRNVAHPILSGEPRAVLGRDRDDMVEASTLRFLECIHPMPLSLEISAPQRM